MVLGWFGRKKEEKSEEEDLGGGLGGFGAVDSFNTESIVDPRANEVDQQQQQQQQQQKKPSSTAFPPPEQPLFKQAVSNFSHQL